MVKKMHGLQVYQDVNTKLTITNGDVPGDANNVEAQAWSITRPADLIGAGIVSGAQPDRQSYIKRATLEVWYKNVYAFPVRMVSILCKARRDITVAAATVYTIMEDGAPVFAPYMSYTTSNTFQKLFKILKTKDRLLPGGAVKRLVRKDRQYNYRAVNADVEGNSVDYTYRKGNLVWVDIFHGTPVACDNEEVANNNVQCRFFIVCTYRYYYSWYRMDLTTPTSNIGINLDTPLAYGYQDPQATRTVSTCYPSAGLSMQKIAVKDL